MNIQDADVLRTLLYEPFANQRVLAESAGYSIGVVNGSLKKLVQEGYLDKEIRLTAKARKTLKKKAPRNAIILAAGFGMRMVPINLSTPKALLEVNGERLIDRLITQLNEAGVSDITVVVGFMKERFEYLIDKYGVDLVVNGEYASKNNLHSLALVADRIHNTYIIPCDIWADSNPFSNSELYSWYMVSDFIEQGSDVRINRKKELVKTSGKTAGNAMIGISYLLEPEAMAVREKLKELDDEEHSKWFWEAALYQKDRMIVHSKVARNTQVVEINTYEQLRNFDPDSTQLKSDAINTIANTLNCRESDIVDIELLKKGMTNRSFSFNVNGSKYIMRIPGEGTDQLINRAQEADVYKAIRGHGLCDDPVYIDPRNGYKITKYLNKVRPCDPERVQDLKRCVKKLKSLHDLNLKVSHTFDVFKQIDFYESLWGDTPSAYEDYAETKEKVNSLKPFVDEVEKDWCLTHIDAVPDNFLFYTPEEKSKEKIQLTDWEYAGMQDPHIDIAMFCIYSMYDKPRCDRLIDLYFEGNCDQITRTKIYAYISICGLLWSNWCEYKRNIGVEFGEYSLRQYRFAKDYYKYATEQMSILGIN